jgi:replicative DNA helicase
MGDKMFYRVCETVTDYGKYVSANEDISKHIDVNKPYYQSIYMYSEEQVKAAKEIIEVEKNKKKIKRPRGVSGVVDVVTKKLVWDFDSLDIRKSQEDTKELVNRLTENGFSENNLGIFFSGGKGFHVEIETDTLLTPNQFKAITSSIAKGLKTYDSVVANPSRIFRVAGTKHNSTGLFKTRISSEELSSMTVQEVQEVAKSSYESVGLVEASLSPALLSLGDKKEEKKEHAATDDFTIDLSVKPSELSNWKYALSQGLYEQGAKHNALLILAATYKGLGKPDKESYYLLKASADLQSDRFGEERVEKERMWNIIEHVYSPLWEGGTYSEDNFPQAIKDFLGDLGIPRFSEEEIDEDLVVNVDQGFDNFYDYATKIDENRLNFGIPELDKILKPQKGHLIGLLAGPGIGKCLKKGTLVLMFDGSFKKVEDIKVNDLLMGDDSTPRKVLSTCKGEEEMYEVLPTKGDSWGCNASHILSLKCNTNVNKEYRKGQIYNMSVKEYLKLPDKTKSKLMQYRVPVFFKSQDVSYHPYVIGTWLAEGSYDNTQICCGDVEVIDEVKSLLNGGQIKVNDYGFKKGAYYIRLATERGQPNPILEYVRESCTLNDEKRVPKEFLVNDEYVRLQTLAGLLDGDGYLGSGCFEFSSKYEGLADDVVYLCRSLGLAAYKTEKQVKLKGWDLARTYYKVSISGDIDKIPTRVPRKQASPRKQPKNVLHTGIKVESKGKGEYYGFELDGNHLYCLGDFTVTHNTSMALELLSNTSKDGCKSLFGSYDMNSSILFQKLLQRETRLTDDEIYDVYRRGDTEQIDKFKIILKKHYENVTFCFKVGQSIRDLKKTIAQREQIMGEKIGLVVIDYIELILSDKSDATQASAEAAQGLREIANSGKVVVVLLQPNKMSSKPDEAPKTYNAAKGSSAIAQAVTSMMGCFRPGYNPEDTTMDKFFGVAVLKNRMGPLGTCYFDWDGPTGRIKSMEDIQRQELQEFLQFKKDNNSNDGDHGL